MKGMTILRQGERERFEILLEAKSKRIRHVCAAFSEEEAVERVKRPYAKDEPEVIRVRLLGPLPPRYAARHTSRAL